MSTTAIYPGSFDPFTNGHLDIVKKAARLFDTLYVVIGVNTAKGRACDPEQMREAIAEILRLEGLDNCRAEICRGLMAEFAAEKKAGYMVRGLRNNMDYNYEENIAEVNKLINPELESIYFRADNVALSSSMVQELRAFHRDVSAYVPAPVLRLL